jgi:hypothetical protein
MRFLVLLLTAVTLPALAKPWNGIEPGVAQKDAVVKKFGEPTKVVVVGGHEVLTYSRDQAIRGTVQAQFRIDQQTSLVDRIDVFPEPIIDQDAIEKNYGAECSEGEREGCYLKRPQDKKAPYFLYAKLGLAIFFKEDGRTVHSFAFLPTSKK